MRLQAEGRYTGDQFKDSLNDPLIATDSYWTLNARAILDHIDGWSVSLWGRNVTDDKTPTTILRSVAFKDDDGTGPYTVNSRAFAGFFPDRSNFGVTFSKRF